MKESDYAAESIIRTVRSVCPDPEAVRALHEPMFGPKEEEYVSECVRTGWVSSVGAFVDRFEADLARVTGARRAVAVVNGTAALQVALALVGVEPGEEVLMPSLTFVGTANAIRHTGAVPTLLDSDPRTLGLDPNAVQAYLARFADLDRGRVINRSTGRRIAAVVPVHIFGHPADVKTLLEICDDFGLPVVEDAAESLGSTADKRHTGRVGRVGVLSFNGNKIVTTGGGGAIITDDEDLADRAKHLTTTGKVAHPWRFEHDVVAWNYRMPNLNAALGCGQLEHLDTFVDAKRTLAELYARALRDDPYWSTVGEPEGARSNFWLNAVLLPRPAAGVLEEVLQRLHSERIGARPAWTLMHRLPMYGTVPRGDLQNAEALAGRILNLPSGVRVARAAISHATAGSHSDPPGPHIAGSMA